MKITEYPSVSELTDDNVFLLDGVGSGTKIIKKSDLIYALYDSVPDMHKQIIRGKSLGSTFTSAQKEAISDGSFHDLWLGDYWTISGNTYRIVDFDYYYGTLANMVATHHVVVMPDDAVTSSTTTFASSKSKFVYSSSTLRNSTAMNNSRSTIQNAFGVGTILTFKDNCIFAVRTSGTGDDAAHCDRDWIDMTIEVPAVHHIAGSGGYNVVRSGNSPWMRQFSLFRIAGFKYWKRSGNVWTRDISGYVATENIIRPLVFSAANVGESPDTTSRSNSIVPYFCLRG